MDVLKIYLAQIKDIPLLSQREVLSLARRIQRGLPKEKPKNVTKAPLTGMTKDAQAACHKLVYHNLRLVPFTVKKLAEKFDVRIEDCIQDGTLALYNAARCYDPERCIRFGTYAVNSIRNFVLRTVHESSLLVAVPQYARVQSEEDRSVFTQQALQRMVSLTYKQDDGNRRDRNPQPVDRLADDETLDPAWFPDYSFDVSPTRLRELISNLPPRERFILTHRYLKPHTLKEIGWKMGITKERVRQLEVKAIERLRLELTGRSSLPVRSA